MNVAHGIVPAPISKKPTLLIRARNWILRRYYKYRTQLRDFWRVQQLDYKGANLKILVDNFREFETRRASCKKEPETVLWLEEYCKPGVVVYDLGANIGAYSLIAATLGAQVIAVEPAFQNFFKLHQNVSLNELDNLISCYNLALANEEKNGKFTFLDTESGTSRCFYNSKGFFHLKQEKTVQKGVLIATLDSFIRQFKLPTPNVIKIDVDGAEADIIAGAEHTLVTPSLSSILIEVDSRVPGNAGLIDKICSKGFKVKAMVPRDKTIDNVILVRIKQ